MENQNFIAIPSICFRDTLLSSRRWHDSQGPWGPPLNYIQNFIASFGIQTQIQQGLQLRSFWFLKKCVSWNSTGQNFGKQGASKKGVNDKNCFHKYIFFHQKSLAELDSDDFDIEKWLKFKKESLFLMSSLIIFLKVPQS